MEIYGDDEMSEVKEAASCSDHGGILPVGDAGGGGSDDLVRGPRPSIGCREKNRRRKGEMQGRVVEDVVGCEDDVVDDRGRRRLKMAMRGDPIPVNCAVGDEVGRRWSGRGEDGEIRAQISFPCLKMLAMVEDLRRLVATGEGDALERLMASLEMLSVGLLKEMNSAGGGGLCCR